MDALIKSFLAQILSRFKAGDSKTRPEFSVCITMTIRYPDRFPTCRKATDLSAVVTTMLILPAVDILSARCVRLEQGKPERAKVYYEDPAEAALVWTGQGAEALHVVDLDGALDTGRNTEAVRRIVESVSCPVQVGGGIRDDRTAEELLCTGVRRIVVGTRAVEDPEWLCALCRRHPGRVVAALDAIGGNVATHGWTATSRRKAVDVAREMERAGVSAILYTDVSRDGMMSHPNLAATESMASATGLPVIASGGVSCVEDIEALGKCGASAVVIGSALYTGAMELPEALEMGRRFPGVMDPA